MKNESDLITTGIEGLKEDKIIEDNTTEYNKQLELLKEKVNKLREVSKDVYNLELELKDFTNKFVEKFSDNKIELGKAVSWLAETYRKDELAAILGDAVKYNEFGISNLDDEWHRIPFRMSSGLKKPKLFSDARVDSLVHMLNTYDNYIETFESIELTDNSNCLDQQRYLISPELHNILINGYRLKRDRKITKEAGGIYVVVFREIKLEGENVLIYKYIKYPYIFYDCLYSYVERESSSLVITNSNSLGVDYLFVLENMTRDTSDQIGSEIKRIASIFQYKLIHSNHSAIYPRNLVDMFKMLLKGCPIFLGDKKIIEFIRLAAKKNVFDFVEEIVKIYDFWVNDSKREGVNMLRNKLEKQNLDNYNILRRIIFVTEDLDGLIKNIKTSYDGRVNQGPQPWRGQSDTLSHTIHAIDHDFRTSMNRHNQYHVNMGNIPKNSLIGKSKFTYQNIHLNIGNVRLLSTKKSIKPVVQDIYEQYYGISEYIKNSPVNGDTQLEIENSLYDYSYISLTEKLDKSDKILINYKLINKRLCDLLVKERGILVDYINRSRVLEFNEEPKKKNDFIIYWLSVILRELNDDFIVSVVYGRLFKIISRYTISMDNNKAVDIFVDIGNDIVGNYFYSLFTKCKKELKKEVLKYELYKLSNWKMENSEIVSKFDNTIKAEIGGKIVSWLKSMDLIRIELVRKGLKERDNVIIPTDRIIDLLDKENRIKPLPRRLPMIIKPNNYSRWNDNGILKESLGGYLLNDVKYTDPLMIPKWNFGKPTIIKDENLVYNLVNNISSVGFKINKDVYDFIKTFNSRYNLLLDSNFVHPLSKKEKLSKDEFIEYSSFLNKKYLQENILIIAEIYSNVHEFFIPTRLDSRGRLYCVSEYLNYQSTELAKSLLLFSKSEKIYKFDRIAIDYLKAYGANCFGNKLDKMSWKIRSKWVDENEDKIINFRNGDLIGKAENKLLFIAFCFEYSRFLDSINNEKDYFETNLPIQLDATCNGYQHLSLLSLDHNLAKELNLTKSNWEDAPKDFYNFTAIKLINYFKNKLSCVKLTDEEKEAYTRFSNLTIARKIVKKVVMTIPYNVTHFAMIDYLKSNFLSDEIDNWDKESIKNRLYYFKDNNEIIFKERDFPLLAKGLKIVIFDDRFKLKKLLKYLNDVAEVVTNLGLPIFWGTPNTGVDIEQSYLATKEERLKIFSYTKKTFKIKVTDQSKYNKRKQRVSFLPNLIHSLDAASLALLIHYYFSDISFSIKNIYTIHDCFAVTANNIKNLTYSLSHVYQKIYTEKNYLKEFDKKMIDFIKYNINKDIDFDDQTLVITTKKGVKLQYPSVELVLGPDSKTDGLIKESTYLIH